MIVHNSKVNISLLLSGEFFHKWIVVQCIYNVTKMINGFSEKLVISQQFYPREIVTGRMMDAKIYLKTPLGLYVEASYDHDVMNDMCEQTHGCISVGESGNIHSLLKCFDLLTGWVVIQHTFSMLYMPDMIMKLLNKWGKCMFIE